GLIQPKALDWARQAQLEVEVTTFAPASTTLIGSGSDQLASPAPARNPLRICLLGRGVVGAGVYERLLARPDLFEITAVAVRRPPSAPRMPPGPTRRAGPRPQPPPHLPPRPRRRRRWRLRTSARPPGPLRNPRRRRPPPRAPHRRPRRSAHGRPLPRPRPPRR